MQTPPPGHFACPRCRRAVPSGAHLCPNCGAAFRTGAVRPKRYSGIVVMLIGLCITLVGGAGFFVNCFQMVSNIGVSSGSERYGPLFQLFVGTAAVGVGVMFIGLVITIVQLVRKE